MKWLTEEQVMRAAKRGHKAALRCSRKHWLQLSTATPEELDTSPTLVLNMIRSAYCALCYRYIYKCCRGCPLFESKCTPCCKQWRRANTIEKTMRFCAFSDKHKWREWQQAATAMYKRLCRECRKAGVK